MAFNNVSFKKDGDDENTVVLLKGKSKFIYCYNDDAIIINYLKNYKILDGMRLGFPDNTLDRVINSLEDKNINYKVLDLGKTSQNKDYKKLNKYSVVLAEAKQNAEFDIRIQAIIEKIKKLDPVKINEILDGIEQCLK